MMTLRVFILFAVYSLGFSSPLIEGEKVVLAERFEIKTENDKILYEISNKENNAVLRGELGVSLSKDEKRSQICDNKESDCLKFGSNLSLRVKRIDQCVYLNWTSQANITITDCFDYGRDNWYGGPENNVQYWPFNNMTFSDFSYISKMEENQGVAEPYWVTSTGFYVYVDKTSPLFIDSNSYKPNTFCISAKQVPPYRPRGRTTLAYKVCAYKNTRKAHMNAVKNELGHPTDLPDKRMIQHPIWSTWVRFKMDVNETVVRSFAQEIVDNGFNNSQLEIDDNWETCYGTKVFNKSRFPNMPKLGNDLHNMGFRITVWSHPFVNTDCSIFPSLKDKNYLVKNIGGNAASTWWDGEAGAVDFTNPQAVEWFLTNHRKMLQTNNIDSVKMDAGESSWLPQIPQLNADINDQPNAFSSAYVRTVSKFGKMVEVRVGHRTQDLPIFVRMLDKDSKWTFQNGIPTLLTTLFQLNLNGYTYVLPDMVGGNAYGDIVTKELFIRWLQANVFMPVIQFSLAPWDFDQETIDISKKFLSLHYAYANKIVKVMQKCVRTGTPVNTPIWWTAPNDQTAHSVWSEYMLGEDILVAPVIVQGAVSRDIYLPLGHQWRDEVDPSHTVYAGGQWLRNYPAPLDTLPYFTRHGRM